MWNLVSHHYFQMPISHVKKLRNCCDIVIIQRTNRIEKMLHQDISPAKTKKLRNTEFTSAIKSRDNIFPSVLVSEF